MAHMKQQIKRYKNDYKKHLLNAAFKSALKTEIKKVLAAIEAGNKEEALKAYSSCVSKLDSSVSKVFIIKTMQADKNQDYRRKSTLLAKLMEFSF